MTGTATCSPKSALLLSLVHQWTTLPSHSCSWVWSCDCGEANQMEEGGARTTSRPGHTNHPPPTVPPGSVSFQWPEWNLCVTLHKVAELSLAWSLNDWVEQTPSKKGTKSTIITWNWPGLSLLHEWERNFCEEPLHVWINMLPHASHLN